MSPAALPGRVAALLDLAGRVYSGHPQAELAIAALRARFDEPLRVAVAGRVKAGKSTLLNALVGHGLAAVDTGDCTRHVTWYVHGRSYEATASVKGEPRQVSMRRSESAIDVDLGELDDAEIDRHRREVAVPDAPHDVADRHTWARHARRCARRARPRVPPPRRSPVRGRRGDLPHAAHACA